MTQRTLRRRDFSVRQRSAMVAALSRGEVTRLEAVEMREYVAQLARQNLDETEIAGIVGWSIGDVRRALSETKTT